MRRWILMHLFPDVVSYLRMVGGWDSTEGACARMVIDKYGLPKP